MNAMLPLPTQQKGGIRWGDDPRRPIRFARLTAILDEAKALADTIPGAMGVSMRLNVARWRGQIAGASYGMLGENGYAPGVRQCLRDCRFHASAPSLTKESGR